MGESPSSKAFALRSDLEVGGGLKEGLEGGALGGESEEVEDGGDLVRDRPEVFGVDESVEDLALEGFESCGFGGRFEAREIKECEGHVDSAVGVNDREQIEKAGDHEFGDALAKMAKQAAEIADRIGFGPRESCVKVGYFGERECVHQDAESVAGGLLGILAGERSGGGETDKCGVGGNKVAFEQRFEQDIVDLKDTERKEDACEDTGVIFEEQALLEGVLDALAFKGEAGEQKGRVNTQSGLGCVEASEIEVHSFSGFFVGALEPCGMEGWRFFAPGEEQRHAAMLGDLVSVGASFACGEMGEEQQEFFFVLDTGVLEHLDQERDGDRAGFEHKAMMPEGFVTPRESFEAFVLEGGAQGMKVKGKVGCVSVGVRHFFPSDGLRDLHGVVLSCRSVRWGLFVAT